MSGAGKSVSKSVHPKSYNAATRSGKGTVRRRSLMDSRKTVNGAYRYRYTPFLNPKYVHPLALPLGEPSPKVTERAFHPCFPSPVSLRSATSPIGRGKRCSSLSHCACQLSDTPRPLRRNSPPRRPESGRLRRGQRLCCPECHGGRCSGAWCREDRYSAPDS